VLVAHGSFYLLERPVMTWARGREKGRAAIFTPVSARATEELS
jgi:hypothetical protein